VREPACRWDLRRRPPPYELGYIGSIASARTCWTTPRSQAGAAMYGTEPSAPPGDASALGAWLFVAGGGPCRDAHGGYASTGQQRTRYAQCALAARGAQRVHSGVMHHRRIRAAMAHACTRCSRPTSRRGRAHALRMRAGHALFPDEPSLWYRWGVFDARGSRVHHSKLCGDGLVTGWLDAHATRATGVCTCALGAGDYYEQAHWRKGCAGCTSTAAVVAGTWMATHAYMAWRLPAAAWHGGWADCRAAAAARWHGTPLQHHSRERYCADGCQAPAGRAWVDGGRQARVATTTRPNTATPVARPRGVIEYQRHRLMPCSA
jgi:hypothetical protein